MKKEKKNKLVARRGKDGKVHFSPKEHDPSFEIEEAKVKKEKRDKLVTAAEDAEASAKKVKGTLIEIAQKETAKAEKALQDKDKTIEIAMKSHEEAEEAAMRAVNKAVYAETEMLAADDAVINAKAKEQSELLNGVEISEDDLIVLNGQVDGQDNMTISIKDGVVIAEKIPDEILWNNIKAEAHYLLKNTDRAVSVTDYHIDGELITEKQLADVTAYREILWKVATNKNEPKNSADFVMPKPPLWLN